MVEDLSAKTPKEVITYSYGVDSDAGWKNILKSYNGEAIDYDSIGNPLTYRGATLDWDTRELKSYKISDDLTVRYKYDADGLRASKTFDDGVEETVDPVTKYQYLGNQLIYESCNGAEKYYFYDSNGVISGIRYFDAEGTMTMIYVVTNALGDIIGLYNSSGNLVVKYEYDAWGNIVAETNATGGTPTSLAQYWSDINPFRYRGYYYDAETELYYLQSRYYDAETGRFINADRYVSTGLQVTNFNMFAYCYNNPVNMVDVNGDMPEWLEYAAEWVNQKVIEPLGEVIEDFIEPPKEFINDVIDTVVGICKYPEFALYAVVCEIDEVKSNIMQNELVEFIISDPKHMLDGLSAFTGLGISVADVLVLAEVIVVPKPVAAAMVIVSFCFAVWGLGRFLEVW